MSVIRTNLVCRQTNDPVHPEKKIPGRFIQKRKVKLDAQAGASHLGRVSGANKNTDVELDAQAAVSHLSGVGGADNNTDAEQDAQAGVGHLGGVGEVDNNTNAKQDAQASAGELGWVGAHLEPSLFLKL